MGCVVIFPRLGQSLRRRPALICLWTLREHFGPMMALRGENQHTMHTNEQYEAIHTIHDLLADSRKEYEAASHRVPDERVSGLLLRISEERMGLEEDLGQDLRQHDPKRKVGDGTLGGALHRALLIFRDTINSTSEVNILVEMERQESDLLGRYNKVLRTRDLGEFTRATLTAQHAEIEKNVKKIRDLRRSMEAVVH